MVDFSIFEEFYFTKLFQTSIETGFFHITFWKNFNAAVWIKKKKGIEQKIRENVLGDFYT